MDPFTRLYPAKSAQEAVGEACLSVPPKNGEPRNNSDEAFRGLSEEELVFRNTGLRCVHGPEFRIVLCFFITRVLLCIVVYCCVLFFVLPLLAYCCVLFFALP